MASHKYENVQLNGDHEHDHDDSRSSTEVESLIGDEKSWRAHQHEHNERKSKRSQLSSILRSSRWMLDTTLLLIIVALLVRNEMKEPVQDQWQLLGDMTGVGPRFPQKLARFEYDTSYAPMNTSEFFTNETLDKWNNLMPSMSYFFRFTPLSLARVIGLRGLPANVIQSGREMYHRTKY